MNNSIFIARCETVLTTMHASNCESVTSAQIAKWLEVEPASASVVIQKMCKHDILMKVGAAAKTHYVLTDICKNSIIDKLKGAKTISQVMKPVVDYLVNHHKKVEAKDVITHDGRRLHKIVATEELSARAKSAADNILSLIDYTERLESKVKNLEEEVKRLKEFEEKYKQIKSLMSK